MNRYARRYKLSKEELEIYEWVKNQGINSDDNTICYWTKTYEPRRIIEVIRFAKKRIEQGEEIKNVGGWIQKFLREGQAVLGSNSIANLSLLRQFLDKTQWKDLKVYEKYIRDTVTGDDLPLTIEEGEFRRALEALYQKSQLYK